MDEPFSALDPLIRRDMQNELVRIQETMRKTTIFITHDLSEAVKLGTRIAIMRDGAIIQVGTPEEIVGNPIDDYVAEFTRDVRPSTVLTVGYLMEKQSDGLVVETPAPAGTAIGAVLVAGQTVDEALASQWGTTGKLAVKDESGMLLGVIDREALLQAAFEHPAVDKNGIGSYAGSTNGHGNGNGNGTAPSLEAAAPLEQTRSRRHQGRALDSEHANPSCAHPAGSCRPDRSAYCHHWDRRGLSRGLGPQHCTLGGRLHTVDDPFVRTLP